MRTSEEILQKIKDSYSDDMFGFATSALIEFLPFDLAKPFLVETAKEEEWKVTPSTHEAIVAVMRDYMAFAWDKVWDHRGISAGRSVEKMAAWAWMLGDDDLVAQIVDDANYPQYGAPALAIVCRKFDFPIPDVEGLHRMIRGDTCEPGCDMGCALLGDIDSADE